MKIWKRIKLVTILLTLGGALFLVRAVTVSRVIPSPAPSAARQMLTGTVDRVTFHNDENGFAILRVSIDGRQEPVRVKGNVATIQPGEGIEARGEWINDPNYGRLFAADEI
jgi:exodeoxyribonuclease V alpha subunit